MKKNPALHEDKRKHPRFNVKDYLSLQAVFPAFSGDRSAEIKDMSLNGLKFKSENMDKIETGEIISTRIYFNSKCFESKDLKVVRKDKDGIACEFMTPNDRNSIYYFLEFLKAAIPQIRRDARA